MKNRRYTPQLHYFRKRKISKHAITKAQKQLHERIGLARFPFENPNPFFRTTPEGLILYGNPACAVLFSTWHCHIGEMLTTPLLETLKDVWTNGTQKTINVDCEEKFFSITILPNKHFNYISFYACDITDHVRIERDLQKREEQLHLALENAHQGLYDYNLRTGRVQTSLDSKSIFGQNLDGYCSIDAFLARLLPEDHEHLIDSIQEYVQSHLPSYSAEFRIKNPKEDWVSILTFGKATEWDENGQPLRLIGTYTDITRLKCVENNLRESEERYRLLFENSIDANILSTRAGDILAVNPKACWIFRYTQEELLERKRTDIVDNTSGQLDKLLEELYRNGTYHGELTFIRKGGERFFGEVSIAVYKNQSGQIRNSVIVRDITEYKRTESALRLNEARLQALYDLSQVKFDNEEELADFALDKAVQLTSSETGYLYFTQNEAIDYKKFYWSSSMSGLCNLTDAERCQINQAGTWADSFRLRRPVIHNEFSTNEIRTLPSGHPLIYRHMSVPVIFGNQVVLVAGVGNKVRPYDEADVRQLQLFAEGVWSLIYRIRDETLLKKALAEKEVLLREVHHRVKNNLQAMIALMDMQKAQINNPHSQRFLLELQQQARTMSLIYELLYQTENLSQVEMADFLRQITTNLLEAYGEYETIDLRVNCDMLLLSVDVATPCGLIVNELVTNAIKHAFPKGFQAKKCITVSLKRKGERAILEVRDNGIGLMAEEKQKKSSSKGLSLVILWATHQLGGQLEIDSQAGTRFLITFHTF